MMWPFSLLRSRALPERDIIEAIYGAIVTQARAPAFYVGFGVPDTVDGRFDMVVLHMWLVVRALSGQKSELAQALVDRFCSDMDDNLRELGVGDLTVPKRMMKFGEAFYGRSRAYDMALVDGDARNALAQALNRNIYNGEGAHGAERLARYVQRAAIAVRASELERGEIGFPDLVQEN